MPQNKNVDRRQFLKKATSIAAGAIAFPYIVRLSALGKAGLTAPSERITLGFIGVGKQCNKTLQNAFLNATGTQVVAVCDVDRLKLERAVKKTDDHYAQHSGGFKGCTGYGDFRELLARDDIDAVVIATPDHWHSILVVQAARAGKDIYCEKPLSLTIAEARLMVNEVRRYGRVFQTGSMQRSNRRFRFACELVRNGYIGQVKTVAVDIGNDNDCPISSIECNLPGEPVPDYLDWDVWLGPAPWRPYHSRLSPHISNNVYPHWRDYRDYSGGLMTDWGAHHFDIAQWALGMDATGPVEVIPPDGKDYKVLTYKYANGITMTRDVFSKSKAILFIGTEGKIEVSRRYLHTWPKKLAEQEIASKEAQLYESGDHYADWLNAIHNRSKPICDVEIGCRSVTICHLGNIAYRLGRPLKWNPATERFFNDSEANRLLSRSMRNPWHL